MRKGTVIYPYEPWTITENSFDEKTNRRNETIFAVANGYIGMRGSFEEGLEDTAIPSSNGTYLNGFYDSTPIIYGEEAFGYAKNHQTMLNVTDSKIIDLIIDGEKFSLDSGTVNAYSRQLDMRKGILFRKVFWETTTGKQVEITIERMVSLTNKHLACIRYRVKPLNFSGELQFISAINGEVHNQVSNGDPRAGSVFSSQVLQTQEIFENDTLGAIRQRTKMTCFDLVCAMEHQMNTSFSLQTKILEQRVEKYFTVHAIEQEAVILDKFMTYYSSKDYPKESLLSRAEEELTIAKEKGYDAYKQGQRTVLDSFWENADITVEGDDALQQGLRFNAYHLFQSVGRDGKTNIAAKGLTGEGYDGHYFWDTETYIMPFFLYTNPEIAKQLLKYRIHILPKAKQRAEELAQKGAMFPWRTIDGEEASACYPAGTAQYHINADIAYAFKAYAEVTGDMEFIYEHGLSVLLETSRFFADFGVFIEGKGFCINGVTGPDEYTAIVNNNTYTNIMVKDLLEYIILILQKFKSSQSYG
ncbi:MAG: trehalose phosphorylase [Bacilli bacterium]|nr:trehalose phosphorylase [Bacilli bacterium]